MSVETMLVLEVSNVLHIGAGSDYSSLFLELAFLYC